MESMMIKKPDEKKLLGFKLINCIAITDKIGVKGGTTSAGSTSSPSGAVC